MTPTGEHDQFLGLTRALEQRLAFLRWNQSVVACRNKQPRTWGDLVDYPLGTEAQGLVNEFQRNLVHRRRIIPSRCGSKFGRLPIWEQDLCAPHEFGAAAGDTC